MFLFIGLSVQGFASTEIQQIDVVKYNKESLNTLPISDLKVFADKIEIKNTITEQENTTLYQNEEELFGCWLTTLHCSCASINTQWCNQGFHGSMMQWYDNICGQACG